MTAKERGNGITAMGLFKDGLDHDIKMKEQRLAALLEGLERQVAGALADLKNGHRVARGGVALNRGGEIDQLCAVLNELYDARIALRAAFANDRNDTGASK
jgi:hypothetical protein